MLYIINEVKVTIKIPVIRFKFLVKVFIFKSVYLFSY